MTWRADWEDRPGAELLGYDEALERLVAFVGRRIWVSVGVESLGVVAMLVGELDRGLTSDQVRELEGPGTQGLHETRPPDEAVRFFLRDAAGAGFFFVRSAFAKAGYFPEPEAVAVRMGPVSLFVEIFEDVA